MSYILTYLERLGLRDDAALVDIRRAYARELKLIDQERDAAGFQQLRQAYEEAMEWIKWRDDPLPVEPEAEAAAAAPMEWPMPAMFPSKAPERVDVDGIAGAAFARFHADFAEMVRGDRAPGLAKCQAVLACALGDNALLNLSARIRFEASVAQLLAAGWQPGHESLLVAATEAFEWSDRRRLFELGGAGAELSQAIDERHMFDAQQDDEIDGQRRVVVLLRGATEPLREDVLRDMQHLHVLMARFPSWLAVVASADQAHRWCELDKTIPEWRRVLAFELEPGDGKQREGIANICLAIVLSIIFMIGVITAMGRGDASRPSPEQHLSYDTAQPDSASETAAAPASVSPQENVARASNPAFLQELQEVNDSIAFEPATFFQGRLHVTHLVELDAFGRISYVKVVDPSQADGFDEAAAAAIRAHGHWGPQSPRQFVVRHSR
jgi:hypothetical protein